MEDLLVPKLIREDLLVHQVVMEDLLVMEDCSPYKCLYIYTLRVPKELTQLTDAWRIPPSRHLGWEQPLRGRKQTGCHR